MTIDEVRRHMMAMIEESIEETARAIERDGIAVDREALRDIMEMNMPLKTRMFLATGKLPAKVD